MAPPSDARLDRSKPFEAASRTVDEWGKTEDDEDVWVTAQACMRNYLLLRERTRAFRADPAVHEALAAARVGELGVPTLGDGETIEALRAERHDVTALAEQGLAFEALDQLAMEHLLGAR